MKRNIALLLMIITILSAFSSCSQEAFVGGKEYFFSHGTALTAVADSFLGAFADCDVSLLFPGDGEATNVDFITNVSKLKINGNEPVKPHGTFDLNATFDNKSNAVVTIDSDLFGQNLDVRLLNKDSEMYIDLGVAHSDILYYAPEAAKTYDFIRQIISYLAENVKDKDFKDTKESFSIEDVTYDADCVTYYVNSDDLSIMLYLLADEFKDNENKFYYYMSGVFKSYANKVRSCRLHFEWKKYYYKSKIVRETFTLTNPDNCLITVDIKLAEKKNKQLIDLSVDGADSSGNFILGGLAIEKTGSEETMKIRINDKVLTVYLEKDGDTKKKGVVTVGYIGEDANYNEAQIGITAEDIKTDGMVYGAKITLSPISPNVDIDAEFILKASKTTSDSISLPEMDKVSAQTLTSEYRINQLMYFGFTGVTDKIKTIISAFYNETIPIDKVDLTPYEFDEKFSDEEIETEGKYGKKLAELLMSDKYSYCFDYISNSSEEHYVETSKTYFDGSKRYYYTKYQDGSENREYVINNVKYAVMDSEKLIVTTSYTEAEVNRYYPRTNYYYANSGKSEYNGVAYIYENYYDRSGNQYHMMFNDGKLEYMWIKDITTKEVLYTMNLEISDAIPEGTFDLPKDYKIIGIMEYYGK